MKTEQLIDCEGITLESTKPFSFTCCDCGLTHHMIIVSEDGRPVGFAVKRVDTPSNPAPAVKGGEPVGEVLIGKMTAILYDAQPVGTKLYLATPASVPALGGEVPISDEEADALANLCYTALHATGYNGGMGGLTWDRALVRTVAAKFAAHPQATVPGSVDLVSGDGGGVQESGSFHSAGGASGNVHAPGPRKSLNAKVADLLRPFLKDGQKVIWREPFRWHDDNGVLSNHYDGFSLAGLCEDNGYVIDYDFDMHHAAIITPRAAIFSTEKARAVVSGGGES
jgi:hypothetical protein